MTTTLIVVTGVIIISAILSLGSMGIFYFIRKRGWNRNRLTAGGGGKSKCEFIIEDDISNGREFNKLPAISYSRHDTAPKDFHYVTEHVNIEPIDVDTSLKRMTCCQCLDDCSDANCECINKSKCGQYYDSDGRLKLDYVTSSCNAIRECNVACKCNRKLCKNMVIQGGCQLRLVLFKTKSRGWGVRTLESIKRGTFVGVYSGELLSVELSQYRQDDTYLFNLANSIIKYETRPRDKQPTVEQNQQQQSPQMLTTDQQIVEISTTNEAATKDDCQPSDMEVDEIICNDGASGEPQWVAEGYDEKCQSSDGRGSGQETSGQESIDEVWEYVEETEQPTLTQEEADNGNQQVVDIDQQEAQADEQQGREENYICDAKFYGNFTRFINHSCEPNVIGIRTFTAHQDDRFPYISFFANQDIQAGEELTLNYGDNYWLVKCKRDKVFCLCKKPTCRFTKKTLNQTLKSYYQQRRIATNSQ